MYYKITVYVPAADDNKTTSDRTNEVLQYFAGVFGGSTGSFNNIGLWVNPQGQFEYDSIVEVTVLTAQMPERVMNAVHTKVSFWSSKWHQDTVLYTVDHINGQMHFA